ncbi:alpha-2-macroglobulin-like [Pempheris klunzingeri]|uniref:alpha-2-macroglobulin-like n=1 Tax=Pempheris klunzingeri TaxID=3127111 RepID=UPI00398036C6
MGPPGVQTRPWTLFVCLSCMFVGEVLAGPQYLVAIPAVIQPGDETKICASLLQPNETLTMTITLRSQVLFQHTSSAPFHTCFQFQAPSVKKTEVHSLKVEVRGNTFYSQEVRKVMFRAQEPITLIQTDKPIYLPGQTVHFRVISMDSKFRHASQRYNVIEMKDAKGNRIGQWLNTTSASKILQLSHSLNPEAHEGYYAIKVWINGKQVDKHFKVEKYVLPKFSIEVKSFYILNVGEEDINVKVDATYTYGQAVPGRAELEMCRPRTRQLVNGTLVPESELCYRQTKKTEKNGCTPFVIKMSTFTKVDQQTVQDKLELKVRVEEEGTGISQSHQRTIDLYYLVGKLLFIDTPTIYKQGIVLEGKVKALHSNDTPVPHKLVHLLHGDTWSARVLQNLTTDSNGIATFSLNTTNFKGDIRLGASFTKTPVPRQRTPYYEAARQTLSLFQPASLQPKTISSLEVKNKKNPLSCDKEETFSILYTIVGEARGSVDVMYLILAKGVIVMQGVQKVEVLDHPVTEGEVSFTLKVSPAMAPKVQVIAYVVLPSETMIAKSADFPTEKCFGHKVSLEFSPSSAVPAEDVTLQVTADPDSLCGVSAIDQSVLIKEPGKTLTIDGIFSMLPGDGDGFSSEVEDPYPCLNVRQRRSYYYGRPRHSDVYGVFVRVGLKMATNLFIRTPSCVKFKGTTYYDNFHMMAYDISHGMSETSIPILTVRTFFPETWIWDLVEVGASGRTNVSLTVPDTITSWETEAFCLSSQGFGLAPRNKLTVFQPFFLELSLPYSIIRGEHFELKATIFNYLSSCMMVVVAAAPAEGYTLTPLSGDQYTSCLCANERKTLSWTMAPTVLGAVNVTVTAEAVASHGSCGNEIVSVPDRGRIDVVTRSLIVKAEGTEVTKTYNWLLCPKGVDVTEEVELQLPWNVINGSSRASVSVLGDILGRAMQNLDGLLRMPYGCGEQNMALLAPNIYILQYLTNTQQLTPAIKEKASNFLTSGYQRQLNYKHDDGAYSTFGTGDGNTWLTAFVLRSFAKAQSFVYIDPEIIEQSKTWLDSKQQEKGCFEQLGELFNNRMKGGVSDQVTLSAYITAAFLEMDMSANVSKMQKSLSCLRESIRDLNNTYTTALLAYVFTLAGDMETRAHLLQRLDKAALEQDGLLHWSQTTAETASLSVEISSYVLLAKLSASPTTEDLGYATRIVRWLADQQNPYGGFSSTQDTVVALQALALYSTLVFSPEGSNTVTVQSPSGQLTFDVNQSNKLVYQEQMLQDVTGKHSLEVKGSACASVQISLHYNIPTPVDNTTVSVGVTPEANCTSDSQTPTLTLKMRILYNGSELVSNMLILDIKMLSGFVPHPESLKELKHALLVRRVEQKEDHVLVYIHLLQGLDIIQILKVTQELPVQNLKPAVVKIYDYYQPDDRAETEYVYPCAAA